MNKKVIEFLTELKTAYRVTSKMQTQHEKESQSILNECNCSTNLLENLYLLSNDLGKIPKCPICNNNLKFLTYKKGYNKTCGLKKCSNSLGKINRDKTVLEKYGVKNAFQNKTIKEKIKQTNLKRYGVENPNQNKAIREKIDASNLKKYGVKNVSQNKDIKKKKEQTSLKNFGVKYHSELQSEKDKLSKIALKNFDERGDEIIKKRIATNLDTYGVESATQLEETQNKKIQTNLKKYGVEHATQSKEIQNKTIQTNLKRYGVKSPMQVSEIFEKQQKSAYKYKKYILPSGKEINIQGYENITLDALFKQGYKEEDITIGAIEMQNYIGKIMYTLDGKLHRYYPDIYIISENKVIEVKSEYIFNKQKKKNLLKKQAVLNNNINFEFKIYNTKKILLK